jgi:hypothetical protein
MFFVLLCIQTVTDLVISAPFPSSLPCFLTLQFSIYQSWTLSRKIKLISNDLMFAWQHPVVLWVTNQLRRAQLDTAYLRNKFLFRFVYFYSPKNIMLFIVTCYIYNSYITDSTIEYVSPVLDYFYFSNIPGRSEWATTREREEERVGFWRENLQGYGCSERPVRGGDNNMEHLIYVRVENGKWIKLAPCSLRSELQCLQWSPCLRWGGVNYSCAIISTNGPMRKRGGRLRTFQMFKQITPFTETFWLTLYWERHCYFHYEMLIPWKYVHPHNSTFLSLIKEKKSSLYDRLWIVEMEVSFLLHFFMLITPCIVNQF